MNDDLTKLSSVYLKLKNKQNEIYIKINNELKTIFSKLKVVLGIPQMFDSSMDNDSGIMITLDKENIIFTEMCYREYSQETDYEIHIKLANITEEFILHLNIDYDNYLEYKKQIDLLNLDLLNLKLKDTFLFKEFKANPDSLNNLSIYEPVYSQMHIQDVVNAYNFYIDKTKEIKNLKEKLSLIVKNQAKYLENEKDYL